ncbi:CDK5 regulatory subunit-associated protein 2 isoform X9 [Ailuropoda melanoleuca]|uniref:CDK5 regulatory subunit-associated protein 2 isoform X9 n=1 Tax=Ailuropoda melanoleuca TaxID=9646 RepID=UPI001493FEE9|nr:CDK5 regulatory subunit-associated protein 2 isoform X9 [Ailuropoda melanoleuca]
MMDSVLEEDVTLPGTLSGCSGLVPSLPDEVDGISPIAGLGNGVLPDVSEETVSPTRARNMKDFENQITELKKENFNLKLRIYFLEERMQQEFDGPTEHVYKTNIELKVEVESLKRELQEREQLLIKASKAVESLAEGGGSEVQRVKEDARKKVQQVEDLLTRRIFHLEEDVKAAQAELEKAFAGTETEKALRLSLENELSEMKRHEGDSDMAVVLEQKDRLIEELKLSLKSKEALIQCLKEEKSQTAGPDESVSSGELRGLSAAPRGEQERGAEAAQMESQKERQRFEERIQALQEDLREKEREIATEKKNSLKRDKAIQGLTMALKSKEKEVEALTSEIEELSAAFAKVTEGPPEAQTHKFQGSEDYEATLLEKAALLAQLNSENLTKSAENHRLRRNIKKVTQELSTLQQERERLEKDLEEAHRESGRGDHTIHDLRNEVEKLRDEVNEREKAVENRYKSLLSESNKKLHSQEQLIRSLTGSIDPKDLLLQKFSEKGLEAVQHNRPSQTGGELRVRTEGLPAKCSLQWSPGGNCIFSEEKQQLDYEELIQVLKKEQDIYTHLVKSLQDPDSTNSLQAELNSIFALRKRLEQDVLSCRNLRKTLEEQISEIRRREEEPFSFYSDQTSYLSICLEEPNRFQMEHFSQEELKKKVSDLIQLVKELYTDNQHLKKTIFDLSCVGFQGGDRLESIEQSELLASKEDEDTTRTGEDDENNFLSDQHLEQSDKIMEDYSKGGCKNGYLRRTDSSILDYDGTHKPGCPGDQSLEEGELLNLLAPFFNEKATLLLESRPDLLKVLRELLLERMCLMERGVSAEHLDGETEKSLKQMAVQLGDELGHFTQVNSLSKSHDERKSPQTAQLGRMGQVSKLELKDASVQTVAAEGDTLRFQNEGKREAWEEKPPDAMFHTEGLAPRRQATALSFPNGTDKDVKKSRLPVLLKPSRSLGNVYRLPAGQEVVAQLQGQILELQGELKEFKIRNKQLHQKLILAEAMMEGRPAADETLQKAQPLVGATYQDSPGEQKGIKTMPCVWRDKEGDSDQHTSYETGKSVKVDTSPQNEVMERTEEDSVTYQHILPESPEPSASHVLSDCEMSEKSSVLSQDQKQDSETGKTSVLANHFSQDLVMEHIQEIRSLRRHLEESIKTNEKLRGQLERQGSELNPGSTNAFAYGSELHNSLTSEICFLRKQNQALNTMLARGSRDKQKENEKLRESLSRKAANLELLQREYACVKGENERLQREVCEQERHNQQLLQEACSSRSKLSRVQEEAKLRQQLLSQNDELLQSLRVELKVYKRLEEEHRRLREAGAEASGEGWRGQDPFSDLRGLLTEIQALRGQLEKSIKTNSMLQSKLEEQLAMEGKKAQEAALTVALQTLSVPELPLQLDKHGGDKCPTAIENSCDLFDSTLAVPPRSGAKLKPASDTPSLSGNDTDSLSCNSGSSVTSTLCVSHLVAGHRLWANTSGCHVLGLTGDYEALCQQIGQGQKLFAEMALQIQQAPWPASPELGTEGPPWVPLNRFVTSVGTAKLILEEAARLLTLFWRVSLPTNGQCTLQCEQTGEMKAEITKLHKKLFEQEKKLQNSVKLLQLSKHQEKVIFDQLVVTHKILRKARGNLELRPGGAHPGTSSPSRPGS